jgi:2'-5' RNA ligase
MRCFLSIDIEENLKNRVLEIQKKIGNLNANIKFVEPENLHFTIKFIGEVNENEVDEIKKSLRFCLKNEAAFKIKICGIGYFGKPNYLRTLWLGIKEGESELSELIKYVNVNIKFGKDEETPHLTIGRIKTGKNRQDLLNFLDENKNVNIGEMNVNEVKLKASILTKSGPIYKDLEIFKLGCENE